MEQVLIGLGILLVSPFYALLWVWGASLVKRVIDKDWNKPKGLVEDYAKLTPEQRMDLEIHRDTTPTQQPPKSDNNSQWLGSPTPQAEVIAQNERVFQEGVAQTAPDGRWEDHNEANRAPDTTITNPDALKPKP